MFPRAITHGAQLNNDNGFAKLSTIYLYTVCKNNVNRMLSGCKYLSRNPPPATINASWKVFNILPRGIMDAATLKQVEAHHITATWVGEYVTRLNSLIT